MTPDEIFNELTDVVTTPEQLSNDIEILLASYEKKSGYEGDAFVLRLDHGGFCKGWDGENIFTGELSQQFYSNTYLTFSVINT